MARKKASKIENVDGTITDDTEPSADEVNGIVPINALQTYGIKILDRYCICIMKRAYYEEDTTYEMMGTTYTFYAGQYGPWKKSEKPYQRTLREALKLVFEWMVQDKLSDAGDISFLVEHMDECLASIEEGMKNLAGLPQLKKLA
jgi:hypothetical protein